MTDKLPEIAYIKGVGPKRAEAFAKMGFSRIEDLIHIYPRDYLINAKINDLGNYIDKNVILCARVISRHPPKKASHPMKILISDGSGEIECLIWGNFFLQGKTIYSGKQVSVLGKGKF
ncbi:MAG: hypothetical protein N2510_09645 [Ignavibacteria bacterium]|nr:hypothetical protein [Ignavibacteria bacterium]